VSLPPVLFVIIQTDASADGGVSSISQVIAGLRHHRPIIVTDRDGARVEAWRGCGIETYVLPQVASKGVFRDPLGALRSYWRYWVGLRRVIKSSGAKVVHANDPPAFQLAFLPTRSLRGSLALNIRDTIDPDRPAPRRRYRFLFSAADHVFYLSRDMADRWAKIAPNAKAACSITYSIVDLERFRLIRASVEDPPVVLLSGVIRPKKGQLAFLRHVAPVLAAQGVSTWLAGDFAPSRDSYMAACAEAAAPLGNAVRFLGYRSDIAELMARSTVIAVASRYEGLVRSMIEGMSCARPVVSFDICSARELLESQSGGAGLVVSVGDYDSMIKAVLGFCHAPLLAASAGEKGRATALRLFTRDNVVARYERIYEMLEADSASRLSR